MALALSSTALPRGRWTVWQAVAGVVVVVAVIVAGHLSAGLSLGAGVVLAAVVTIVVVAAASPRIPWPNVALVAIGGLLVVAQLLQNSRGNIGLYYLSPYNWAYNANPISDRIHASVNAEEWLLANTKPTDTILDWVQGDWVNGDRELYVAAGMQLWAENRVTLEPRLTADDIARLNRSSRASSRCTDRRRRAWSTSGRAFPLQNDPSAPVCYDFPWTPNPVSHFPVTAGHLCLTTLRWDS